MAKPILLDLFAGAGGCTKGYQQAGFEVHGVDIMPQKRYPGERFEQADAIAHLQRLIESGNIKQYAAVHASPPCQAHTLAQRIQKREHPELIAPTRELMKISGLLYVIENVPGAPLEALSV